MDAKILLNKIIDRVDLTSKEAGFLLETIIRGNLNPSQIAAVLIALRTKGESIDEIVGFIQTMRKHMLRVPFSGLAIDIVGTGGDGAGTFNISTAASFVVAGAGVKVAKHGNRAASSKCGSADVLEALGVNINLTPQQAAPILKKVGMVFLFAPLYHPAMKNIAPIRKELGIRTVFNFLGPFLNPALTKRQLLGVPTPALAKKLAEVARRLNYKHLIIVSSSDGMDEISISEQTHVFEIKGKTVRTSTINPNIFGIKKSNKKNILGGDAVENSKIIRRILGGEIGARRDIVVLNSAYALYISGKVKTVREGIKLAEKAIDSGSAKQILENLIKETKKYEKKI